MEIYIYLITNLINNKKYIGQTFNPSKRWKEHCRKNQLISKAIKKHGKENFSFDILEMHYNQDDVDNAETRLIKCHSSHVSENGYNIEYGGRRAPCSIGIGKIISLAKKGKPNGTKGIKRSEETKLRMSKSQKGHSVSEKQRKSLRAAFIGKTWKLIDGKRVWFDKEIV